MFVNLLELLQFVYLIKYCFIKRQAGSCRGWEEARGCAPPSRSFSLSVRPSV